MILDWNDVILVIIEIWDSSLVVGCLFVEDSFS